MSSDNFEQKIREKFADAQIQPRPELWQNIEMQLADQRSRRRGLFWIFGDGLLGLLLLLLIVIPPFRHSGFTSELDKVYAQVTIDLSNTTPCEQESLLPSSQIVSAQNQSSESNPLSSSLALSESSDLSAQSLSGVNHPVDSLATNTDETIIDHRNNAPHTLRLASASGVSQNSLNLQEASITSLSEGSSSVSQSTAEQSGLLERQEPLPLDKLEKTVQKATDVQFEGHLHLPSYILDTHIKEEDPPLEGLALMPRRKWGFYGYVIQNYSFNQQLANLDLLSTDNTTYDFTTLNNRFQNAGDPLASQFLSIKFPRWHTQIGVGAEYFLHRNFSIQAGLAYTVSDYGYFLEGSINPSLNIPSSGAININQESLSFNTPEGFRNKQIELPVYLNYYLHRGRKAWVFSLGGAVSRNAIFASAFKAEKADLQSVYGNSRYASNLPTPQPELLVYRTFHAYLAGRIHYQYALSSNMHLYVGPNFQTQVSNVYEGEGARNQFPHRIGVELGIKWRRY
ncbi:MAG: hypothetical protein R3B93_03325 [Bacteroidia bacterium]